MADLDSQHCQEDMAQHVEVGLTVVSSLHSCNAANGALT